VDFPQGAGTPIPAVADGTVVVKTYSSCLGYVVVLQHGDGMFSGYAHMLGHSPHGIGARLSIGTPVGTVGNTGSCTTGPHLHLTMSPSVDGWGSGTTVDPYPYITARAPCNRAPHGHLDAATCDGISGWAQDPDVASSPIRVHVYIDGAAGTDGARGFSIASGIRREDLCGAIGSCDHGFSMPLPPSFFDGETHSVHAYGIDSAGGANTLLAGSPIDVRCDMAPLPMPPEGLVRRHIPAAEVLAAWRLADTDIAPLDDAILDGIPDAPDLGMQPELVQVAGMPEVYVRENRIVRHIPDIGALTAWRFDVESIQAISAEELATELPGASWSSRPFLATGSGDDVYVLDAPPPLWAELVTDDFPSALAPGDARAVTLRLRNRGSMTWDESVELASTPRDEPSAVCDSTWPSCMRVGAIAEAVAPGEEGDVRFSVRAPMDEGPVAVCFGLVTGEFWFSDPGQNGPADDTICRTLEVTTDPAVIARHDGGVTSPAGETSPPPSGGADELVGGCACRASVGAAPAAHAALLAFGVLVVLVRRRRRR
jgi:hypothetical protein